MADALTSQVLIDGPVNQVEKYDMYLDTADWAQGVLTDPSTWNFNSVVGFPRIDAINYSIEDGLAIDLFWDATTPQRICTLYGRGEFKIPKDTGWPNNGGAGATGKVLVQSQGWTSTGGLGAAGIYTATWVVKYRK